ncbi:MAG: DUF3558 domain-containing protein [Actinobacteria bacterium]|nr:DUF3558 domain-containing protein [Actinomycetota bacterium]
MRLRFLASLIATGSVIVLAACSADAPPESLRPNSSESVSPIPPVKNPRDVGAMAQRPCELLTPQQAAEFGLDLPPKQLDGLLGTLRCKWTSTTRERQIYRTVDLSMFTNNPTLEVAYSQDRVRPSFELTEIAGYPTLVSRPLADEPICDIDVKPAERQSFSVTYESRELKNDPQQSCEVGKQVATAVLMNLPLKG